MYYAETDDLDLQSPADESCSRGHRSSLTIATVEGGSICLVCFSNLITNSAALSHHVSYALTQLTAALSQPRFLETLLTFHPHFLVSPLLHALSLFSDPSIARLLFHLISTLSSAAAAVAPHFLTGLADLISSSSSAWIPAHLHILHCFGLLLSGPNLDDPYALVNDKVALLSNIVAALQIPNDEIQGEVLFVLYRLSIHAGDEEAAGLLLAFSSKLWRFSLDVLLKTQNDTVRLNCLGHITSFLEFQLVLFCSALLTVLAQRGWFGNEIGSMGSDEADSLMQTEDERLDAPPLTVLFSEAIKGSLLSSDRQIQVSALDLIMHYLTRDGAPSKEAQILLEENIVDYVFEILRLSEHTDPVTNSCLLVLDLLSAAEKGFTERLVVGFSTLVPVLCYTAEVPFHPVQGHALKLIRCGISNFPGILSSSHVEEIYLALVKMLKSHADGDLGMQLEIFAIVCSLFATLLGCSTLQGNLVTTVQEAINYAILACLNTSQKDPRQLLHAFYLVKEAYSQNYQAGSTDVCGITDIRNCIINICTTHLLPWIVSAIDEIDEEVLLGLLETFHVVLVQDFDNQTRGFAEAMVTTSWFSLSFGCLGLFPTQKMKRGVYTLFSSLVNVLGTGTGQCILDAAADLPIDPMDLLFLLGQNSHDTLLSSYQSAVLLILHTSSLYNDRLADEKSILASIEQYVLVNYSDLLGRSSDTSKIMQLINLYGLCRGFVNGQNQISYSLEAENAVLHLVSQNDWDLLSSRIHFVSLKWLFQQEKISKLLSYQILKFSRSNSTLDASCIVGPQEVTQTVNLKTVAELASSRDNYAARILVCLLVQLVEEDCSEEVDILLVLDLIKSVVTTSPTSADELCLNGVANALRTLHYSQHHSPSLHIFTAAQISMSNVLCCVNPEALCDDDEAWLAVTVKMIDCIVTQRKDVKSLSNEGLQVIANFCLILHQSTKRVLLDASKAILFNVSLVSMVDGLMREACSKGPNLVDYDEGTSGGENLLVLLLLCYFSLRSIHTLLPESVDWETLLEPSNDKGSPTMGINCNDLCRLMHFGSPLIKLVASYCLLEIFTRISQQMNEKHQEMKCCSNDGHLASITAILQGLMFYSDTRVSTNCGLCLSMLLSWLKTQNDDDNWCRLIVEEMTTSLALPCFASKSFLNHHKPAVHVAVAMLQKTHNSPPWIGSVLDEACIDGILKNLTSSNVTIEILVLLRQLMNSKLLKSKDQVSCLNRLLQECRKQAYDEEEEGCGDELKTDGVNEVGEVCEYLIQLLISSSPDTNPRSRRRRLLEEVEKLSKMTNAR
ncbi:Protein PUTATIVE RECOMBINATION INITIATION DEFECT 1 [Linum perenne]